jgi:hypothetical protein
MAGQTVYACSIPIDAVTGTCLGDSIEFTVDSDLGEALNTHATALDANTAAMNDFFTLSPDDVSLISAIILITFIVGNSVGKVASIMRKV